MVATMQQVTTAALDAPWALLVPALAIAVALAVDRAFGEPPARWHPVVWMGRYLGAIGRHLPALPARRAFTAGTAAWLLGAVLVTAIALVVDRALHRVLPAEGAPGAALLALALGLLLKPMLAWRLLREEVQAVETALGDSVDAGRRQIARLASRDTRSLSATQVRETAIETLAENLNDSVVAPLFWFAVAGLPGAVLFRYANTADAMWGYRGRWEWAGKCAAKVDDALAWLPARIAARALLPRQVPWGRLAAQARVTPSPNGGWPMGAMALALGVRLRKPGVYELHAQGRDAVPADLAGALRRAGRAVGVVAVAMALLSGGLERLAQEGLRWTT
jgi:adenosylcobinamide-phosphate synthase